MKKLLVVLFLIIFLNIAYANGEDQINWLKSQQNLATELVDSYEGDGQNYAYTYDQALAIISFTEANEIQRAKNLLDRMQALQRADGSWYQCYNAANGNLGHWGCNYYPTGDISWMVMAINFYQSKTRDDGYSQTALKALSWLDTVRNTNPAEEIYGSLDLCRGTSCNYPNAISTENNYDAYSAYYYRGVLEKNYSLIEKANLIKDYLIKEMWSNSSESNGPFHNVGVFWVGYNDFGWYTDPQSWGVLALGSYGPNGENFTRALEWLYTYGYGYGSTRHNQTYNPEIDGFDFWTKPVKNSTWLEGTEGVAATFYFIGDNEKGDYFHSQTEKVIAGNGGIIYSFSATDPSNIRWNENFRHNSIASTAWYYFNEKKINPFKLSISWYDDFVKVNGTQFYLDGKPFYFAGTNNYYLWYKSMNIVREILDEMVAMNLSVIRTWGFCNAQWKEGYCFQPSPGVYDENTFVHFDEVIKEVSDRGLKLVIPLVNNWDDFGGMETYVQWCNATDKDEFYTTNCTKNLYKNYISYFLNRINTKTGIKYKDDPTIMAWQLANEPRASSNTILNSWIEEISAYIKSIDPNHLLTTGEEGFYSSNGNDFIKDHNFSTIDYTSFHLYPDKWGMGLNDALNWIKEHTLDAHSKLNKPVTLNEYGVYKTKRDEYMQEFYEIIEKYQTNGDMFWILYHDLYPDYDGYGVYYPADASTVEIIIRHANTMKNLDPTNSPPIIEPIGDIFVNPDQEVRIEVIASDEDKDILSYYIDDNRFNQADNVFSWQTQNGDEGVYQVHILVTDGHYFVGEYVTITVFESDCVVPVDGMEINETSVLCLGIYTLPLGLRIKNDHVLLDCNGSLLLGNNKTGKGIEIDSDYVTIKNCKIDNYEYGIYSLYDDFGTFINNTLSNNSKGIYLDNSDSNNIINNTFINNSITGWHSDWNVFRNNLVINPSYYGFLLHHVKYSKFINNTVMNCSHGFHIWWGTSYNTFENNIVTNNGDGFWFDWHSNYNLFKGNIVNNNSVGFNSPSQWYSIHYNNTFVGNEVKNNSYGFKMGATVDFIITDNIIANNHYGITLEKEGTYESYGNSIYRNDLINNGYGIKISNSENNTIYHNNFINNSVQASDNKNNSWDNSMEGNYWDDYDEPSEGCVDSDDNTICDSPYVIDLNSQDNYPFTKENGWFKLFEKELIKGWNLISFPLNLKDKSIKNIFKNIDFESVFSYDSWLYYFNETNNNFNTIDESKGYWINSLENQTLVIEGTEFNLISISLNDGWNLAGYLSLNETNISEMFDNVIVYMYNNSNWHSYITDKPSNTLTKFIPGYGYWVKEIQFFNN